MMMSIEELILGHQEGYIIPWGYTISHRQLTINIDSGMDVFVKLIDCRSVRFGMQHSVAKISLSIQDDAGIRQSQFAVEVPLRKYKRSSRLTSAAVPRCRLARSRRPSLSRYPRSAIHKLSC
jgi:hypothetical protein